LPNQALILKNANELFVKLIAELKAIREELQKIRKALNRMEGW